MLHATDVIRREHDDIAMMADVLDSMLARHRAGRQLSVRDMPTVVNRFLRYADHLHHAKEEVVLFPAILRHDPESLPVLDRLMEEHQKIRAVLVELETAIAEHDLDRYYAAVEGYLVLIRAHLDTENNLLLPTADTFLTPEEQDELADSLAHLEQESLFDGEAERWAEARARLQAYKTSSR